MVSFWTRSRAASAEAEAERQATVRLRAQPSKAVQQAERVIRHADINGWTRIAKELFAS